MSRRVTLLRAVAAGSLVAAAAAPAASASVRLAIPDIRWGSNYCAGNWIEVRNTVSSSSNLVWAEMFGYCTAVPRVRVELYGPGGAKKVIDGYLKAGAWSSQTTWLYKTAGTWTACGSFRNNDWTLVSGTRVCASESYK